MSTFLALLPVVGYVMLGCGVRALFSGNRRGLFGWFAAGSATLWLVAVLRDRPVAASILAGLTALQLWLWWNSGGGDGTRRRLRKWARQFQGTRRTAPAAHAAMTTPVPRLGGL